MAARTRIKSRRPQRSKLRYPASERKLYILFYTGQTSPPEKGEDVAKH